MSIAHNSKLGKRKAGSPGAFPYGWSLLARSAPALCSARRRGFPATDWNDSNFCRRLEFGWCARRRTGLLVNETLSFVVPEDHLVFSDRLEVFRQQRYLAPTAGRIDHAMRHCHTRTPA